MGGLGYLKGVKGLNISPKKSTVAAAAAVAGGIFLYHLLTGVLLVSNGVANDVGTVFAKVSGILFASAAGAAAVVLAVAAVGGDFPRKWLNTIAERTARFDSSVKGEVGTGARAKGEKAKNWGLGKLRRRGGRTAQVANTLDDAANKATRATQAWKNQLESNFKKVGIVFDGQAKPYTGVQMKKFRTRAAIGAAVLLGVAIGKIGRAHV